MASPGWANLGSTLAGGNALPAQLAEAQGEQLGANTTNAIAQANERIAKNKAKAAFGDILQQDPRFQGALGTTMAGAAAAGYNPQEFYGGAKTAQETDLQSRIADVNTPENSTARALLALGKNADLIKPVGTAGDVLDLTKQGQPDQYGQLPLGAALGKAHIAQTQAAAANQTAEAAKNNATASMGGVKPSNGFGIETDATGKPMLDINGHPRMYAVPGGPKDPETSQPMGAVTLRYFQNSMNGALQGATALANVMRSPVGASTGLFGRVTPGHSIMSSLTGNAATAVTPEEDQNLNTILSGLEQNLAVVDNSGRQPNSQYVDAMSRVRLLPGNTEGARLMKLAEARQVLENGLNAWKDTVSLNSTQKAAIDRNLATIKTAIPFSVEHVQNFLASKNPSTTIADMAAGKGLNRGGPAAPAPGTATAPTGPPLAFKTEQEAEDADLDPGTKIIINGRPATWQ